MIALITDGIKVSVEAEYHEKYSNPKHGEYMFGYKVTIENLSDAPMKLQERHWQIFDSDGSYYEEEGQGVAGVQPVILHGKSYDYVSGYTLHTEIGKMKGSYLFENLRTSEMHHIPIPTFNLVSPFKLN